MILFFHGGVSLLTGIAHTSLLNTYHLTRTDGEGWTYGCFGERVGPPIFLIDSRLLDHIMDRSISGKGRHRLHDTKLAPPTHAQELEMMACALIASQGLRRSAARIVRSRTITSECVPFTSDTYCLERGHFARVLKPTQLLTSNWVFYMRCTSIEGDRCWPSRVSWNDRP
jgi:hypothetical protein